MGPWNYKAWEAGPGGSWSNSETGVKLPKPELQGPPPAQPPPTAPSVLILEKYSSPYSRVCIVFLSGVSFRPCTTWSFPWQMNSPLCIIFLYCSWQRRGRFSLRRDSPHLAPRWKSPAGLMRKYGLCYLRLVQIRLSCQSKGDPARPIPLLLESQTLVTSIPDLSNFRKSRS